VNRPSTTSDVFNAIAAAPRRQIIELLARERGVVVGTIVVTLGLPQPAVSKHLGVLRKVGIVSVTKQGQHRVYVLNLDRLRPIAGWLKTLERHWEHQLDRIRARAEARALARALTPPSTLGKTNRKKGTP
jgi:DNA-binding transcriptional ArsR family regulator